MSSNTEEIIFTRNAEGEVDAGGIHCRVPKDHSVLSVFGNNSVYDGDDFRDDGWVYQDGKRVRKWFRRAIRHNDARIWAPRLDGLPNLAILEAKRWKWRTYHEQHMMPEWRALLKKIKAVKRFGGHVYLTERANGDVEIEYSDHGEESGVGWSWKTPSVIDQQLTDEYFSFENRNMLFWKRMGVVDGCFRASVDMNCYSITKRRSILHLVINGRDYWFRRGGQYDDFAMDAVVLPEDTRVVQVKV